MVSAESDDFLEINATVNHVASADIGRTNQFIPKNSYLAEKRNNVPNAVATPLPPLNFK